MTDQQPRLVDLGLQDAPRLAALMDLVWFEVIEGLAPPDYVERLDFSRTRGVEVDEPTPVGQPADAPTPLAGMYSAWGMRVSVPGPHGSVTRVPMSGLTEVGVHPDQRRRGILRQMMTDHLHGLRERGEAVAGLHAAEVGIYGRFGYGTASLDVQLTLSRGATLSAGPELDAAARQVRTHFVPVDTDEASHALHDIHLRSAQHALGAVTRSDDTARVWYRDHPTARREKEPLQVMFATREGSSTGYAVFRRISKWGRDNNPEGEVSVVEMGAVDHGSLLALARRLVDVDLTSTVRMGSRSTDDPVLWWAGGPRSAGVRASDALWVRVVEVGRAMSDRGYAAPCDLVLEVTDEVCPWNARRWRLVADRDGVGRCVPTDDQPDLQLPVAVLGAAYLGGRSIASQADAGLVTELGDGAVLRLSRAMRADTEPVGAIGF